MSKERARLRAEREREAAIKQAARAEADERARRSAERRRRLTRFVPTGTSRQTGVLAERRRRQTSLVIALTLGAVVLVYAFSESWGLTAMVAIAGVLGAPVLHTLMFRR